MKNKKWRGFSFVLPSLAGIAVFVLIPFLDVVRRSFTEVVHGTFTGLTNYRRTFSNEAFLLALRNTVRFELFCIPILLAVSFGTALVLVKQTRASLAKSCMLIPLAVPVASVVLLWRVSFHEQGVLNRLLAFLVIHFEFL